jgi:penicillin-binding protein 1A
MNASVDHFPPKQIAQPPTLKKVEICSRSGLIATDRCYDTVKGPNGETVQHRTSYMEIGTAAQVPTELCNVHGEPRTRLVREATESEFPRAASAVDLKEIRPVIPKAPTLLADKDPYNSARGAIKPAPTPEPAQEPPQKIEAETAALPAQAKPPEPGAPIMKAIPVQPSAVQPAKAIPVQPSTAEPAEIRKAVPVGPLDEVQDESMLKTSTPPPTDLENDR